MVLLFQVLAILAAGSVATALIPALSRGAAIALAAGVIAASVFWTQAWPLRTSLVDSRRANAAVSQFDAENRGATIGPANADFLEWVRKELGDHDTFALAPGSADDFLYQWTTYQLTPRLMVPAERAEWLIFYNLDPRTTEWDRDRFGAPRFYSPGFGIARADAN